MKPLKSPPFGRDVSATDRVRAGVIVTGARLVAEALYRRWITPKGSVEDHPDDGEDVEQWCGCSFTEDELASIGPKLRAEGKKDDRIGTLDVLVRRTSGRSDAIDITGRGVTKSGDAFALSLRVGDVVDVIALTPGGADG